MSGFYTRRPFTTHDGPDQTGLRAEVRVVTGFTTIQELIPSEKGQSVNVIFRNPKNPRFKVSGWAKVSDKVLMDVVNSAFESQEPVEFRIESRRKPEVDRKIPIADLIPSDDAATARKNIYKSLAAVRRESDSEWVVGEAAVTNMQEDPVYGTPSANDYTLEQLRAMSAPTTAQPPSEARSFEAPPFRSLNADGKVNPGSSAVGVPLNLLAFVEEWCRDKEVLLDEEEKKRVVRAMLYATNNLQLAIYEGALSQPDLSLGSHTRARAVVYDLIRSRHPLTKDVPSSRDALTAWTRSLCQDGLELWRWSINEVSPLILGQTTDE